MKVYLIGDSFDEYSKIGKSDYPDFRLEDIDKPKLPFSIWILAEFEAYGEAGRVEKELHQYFAKQRIRGEWFYGIDPAEFLEKAKEFTGHNPKPSKPLKRLNGRVAVRRWWDDLEKNTPPEKKQKIYKDLEAFKAAEETEKC